MTSLDHYKAEHMKSVAHATIERIRRWQGRPCASATIAVLLEQAAWCRRRAAELSR
jgi:hypothetical protein